jgi:DNA processing protein
MSESAAWIALSLIEHLGGHKLRALLDAFGGDVEAVLAAEPAALQLVPGIGPKLAAAIRSVDLHKTEQAMRRWAEAGVHVLPRASAAYPPRLRALGDDAPPTLFARGHLAALTAEMRSASLVGTRHPSTPAREAAFRLGMELALEGWAVVSGLASGIDAAAHHGAASGRGRGVAVLGSGVLQIFPAEHASLAELLLRQGGALVSEVSPDARASTPRLVARNRLISGLSDTVIIVETQADGGAMYAARAALAQGRALCALDLPASGNQALIAAGAVGLPASAHAAEVLHKMR